MKELFLFVCRFWTWWKESPKMTTTRVTSPATTLTLSLRPWSQATRRTRKNQQDQVTSRSPYCPFSRKSHKTTLPWLCTSVCASVFIFCFMKKFLFPCAFSRILQGFGLEQVLLELRIVHPKPPARKEKERLVVVFIAQVANQPATRAARQERQPRKPLLSAKQVRENYI